MLNSKSIIAIMWFAYVFYNLDLIFINLDFITISHEKILVTAETHH